MGKIIHAADLFCGAGGTSTGLAMAAETMGLNLELIAVNHWNRAIETHSKNHPWANHLCTGLDGLKPSKVVPGGKLDLLVASPECTHHSVARGGKPRSDQSRASAWHVLHWCQELYVRNVLIENVPEFMEWGPLGSNGKPLKSKKGHTFQAFINALRSLGYSIDSRILNCADYGDATTRQRLFLMARRGNRRPVWPSQTHWQSSDPDMFGGSLKPWKPARDIIDWSIPGHSIFLAPEDAKKAGLKIKRPLAKNTIRRIEAGVHRFWGEWAEPFLVLLRGTRDNQLDFTTRSVDSPIPTVTTSGARVGLCRPFLVRYNGNHDGKTDGDTRFQAITDPITTLDTSNRFGLCKPLVLPQDARGAVRTIDNGLPTITATGAHALLTPFMMHLTHGGRTHSIKRPTPTLTCANRGELGLISPFLVKYYGAGTGVASVDRPLDTVTTDDRFGLVRPMVVEHGGQRFLLDILFRMLTPAELSAAHSFPENYYFAGTKADVVKQIGNSVPVHTAMRLCESQLPMAA